MAKPSITNFEEFLIEETEYQKTYRFGNNFGARVYFGPRESDINKYDLTPLYFNKDGTIEIYSMWFFTYKLIFFASDLERLNSALRSIKKEGSKSYQKGEK